MKNYVFYILLAFVTFTVVIFLVYQSYKSTFSVYKISIKEAHNKTIVKATNKTKDAIKKEKFSREIEYEKCESNSEFIDLKPILKKWLNSKEFKNVPYCSSTVKESTKFSVYNVTPTLVDVNQDGIKEIALRSGCSPTGNCDFEIYEKTKKGYRRIMNAFRDVNTFNLEKGSFKSYRNIKTTMHGSYNSGDGVIYKYKNKEYKPYKCFQYLYEEYKDTKGNTKNKKKPTIHYFKCK